MLANSDVLLVRTVSASELLVAKSTIHDSDSLCRSAVSFNECTALDKDTTLRLRLWICCCNLVSFDTNATENACSDATRSSSDITDVLTDSCNSACASA